MPEETLTVAEVETRVRELLREYDELMLQYMNSEIAKQVASAKQRIFDSLQILGEGAVQVRGGKDRWTIGWNAPQQVVGGVWVQS